MSTMRRRMVVTTIMASGITLTLGGMAIYIAVRFALTSEFDVALWARAHAIANDVEYNEARHQIEYHAPSQPESLTTIQVEDSGRNVLGGSGPSNWIDDAAGEGLSQHRLGATRLRQVTLMTPALIEDALPGGQAPPMIRVSVVRSTAEIDDRLEALVHLLLGIALCIGSVLSVLMALAARSTLRPLDALAAELARLKPGDPGARISPNGIPSELIPVVARLNDLLTRVEHSMASERRFNAALAHELRTPLAGLQTVLDVHLAGQRPVLEYQEALRSCARICTHMRALVQGLLLLAQADAGLLAHAGETVVLTEMLQQEWAQVRVQAELQDMTMSWAVPRQLSLVSDPTLLALVIRNLIDNAVSHGHAHGEIHVAAQERRCRICLVIGNNGCTLAPDQVPHVFDRLWRGDAARAGTGAHCGLGLTLCREVLRVLGGTITVKVEDGWFEATVDLPSGSLAVAG